MDTLVRFATCVLFFSLSFLGQVLCSSADSNNSYYNSWSNQGNQPSHVGFPNSGQTTPWPELGQRRQHNPPNFGQTPWPELGQRRQNGSFNSGQTTPWPALGQRRQNGDSGQSNSWSEASQPRNGSQWVHSGSAWVRAAPHNTLSSSGSRIANTFAASSNSTKQEEVQDDELRNFSERLLDLDENNAAGHVTVNFQRKTTSRSNNDEAPLPLLNIGRQAYNIPTIAKLMVLYDNYLLESSAAEQVTNQERQEEDSFLDAILNTSVMSETRDFLINAGKIGRDPNDFRDLLRRIWFDLYARGGRKIGSSGFEHVFLAEIKNGGVSGLHNWVYFSQEESKNSANYLGYLKKLELGSKGALLKHHFLFHNIDKPVGSMFIGTSPEFEIALYTTCFVLRADKVCPLRLAGHNFIIRTFTYRYGGKELIGSAFPEI